MKIRSRRTRLATFGIATLAILGISGGVAAAAAGDDNPQRKPANSLAAAPNACSQDAQVSPGGSTELRLSNNVAYTLPNVAGWQRLKCTTTSFTVPRGELANVFLDYSGEFDASGAAGNTGWVQSRIVVTPASTGASVLTVRPDNTDRGDSFALDGSKGEYYDWSAHIQQQSTQVRCADSDLTTPCTFRVRVEGMLTAGADYFWYDDTMLTVRSMTSREYGMPKRTTVTP